MSDRCNELLRQITESGRLLVIELIDENKRNAELLKKLTTEVQKLSRTMNHVNIELDRLPNGPVRDALLRVAAVLISEEREVH